MKIAVTGGAGFIASHIVSAYIEAGHEVVVIDNLSSGKRENVHNKARLIEIDINDPKIAEIFAQEKFDILNHHAAQINVRYSVEQPIDDAHINVIGSLNLFTNAVKNGVRKIIFASSAGTVYGDQSVYPCDELHPTNPLSPYGVSKISAEMYLHTLRVSNGVSYTALRYSNVFGPRQNPHGEAGVVAIFLTAFLNGKQPSIFGDGLQTRDYVYVGDAVKANILALQPEIEGAFNISSSKELSVHDVYDTICNALSIEADKIHTPAKKGEPRRGCYANKKAEDVLGWNPTYSFQEAIQLTTEWFKQNIGSI
jgi:UDP-glucose 4-epimerase